MFFPSNYILNLGGGFQESSTQTVTFKYVKVEIFGLVVYWLYQQKIDMPDPQDPENKTPPHNPKWKTLASLWILGDYLQIPSLQNHTKVMMHGMVRENTKYNIRYSVLRQIYDNTLTGSALSKF